MSYCEGMDVSIEKMDRSDILSLRNGEVIKYRDPRHGTQYLFVESIDMERKVVSGMILEQPVGVNAIPIQDLVEQGIAIAKYRV
ncbi:hypothetical protein J4217_03665 [Candidatus Pacearchaeota archaeon]|nr:hypothetical protein [uncultured archaeon]MBS3091516.1 hypothetical protein [Candidatus Pacearchaeota archaeon]